MAKNWLDTVINTVQKNARSAEQKAMSASLKNAGSIGEDWMWIDFVDPKTGLPCLLLEWLFGCRGALCGRMIKIEAMEGVGKSSYCFLQYAMAQKAGGYCWHGESEFAPPPPDYIASFGCDPDNLAIQQPGSIERAFTAMEQFVSAVRDKVDPDMQHPIVVGLDSISGFGSDVQIDADDIPDPSDTKGLGAHARKVSQWFRDRGHILDSRKVLMMVTAQLKEKIEIGMVKSLKGAGSKQGTTIAANPLNFHSTIRLRMTSSVMRDKGGNDIGEHLHLLTTKNKLSPRNRQITLNHHRDTGFDLMSPTLDWLRTFTPWTLPDGSVFDIQQAGAYIKCDRLCDGKSKHSNEEGKRELMEAFYADEDLVMQCREYLKIRGFDFPFERRYRMSAEEAEDNNVVDA